MASNGVSLSKKPEIKFTKLFINGGFVDSISGRTFETRDPSTGEVIANIAEGDKEDIDLAVKAAREAFDHGTWPRKSGFERGRIMLKLADLIDQHQEELAILESLDAGKLFHHNKIIDIPGAANMIRYYAGVVDKIHGETMKCSGEFFGYTLKEPIGVVGHIIPWNFPSIMFFTKVSPALAVGCTMIVKPAEQTPLTALYYANLAKEAGIPDGVLNVVTGFGSTAGAALCSHMNVDAISFTGSTEVGRLVMEAAARSNLKHVSLELGGKSPLIIFNDADINMAIDIATKAIFYNKGEICIAGSRVFVQEGIYDEFIKKIPESLKNWVVGDPFDSNVNQGPQVDKKQFEKILRYIEYGKRDGATLLTGGKPCGEKGYFIEPTIFTDVKATLIEKEIDRKGREGKLRSWSAMEAVLKMTEIKYTKLFINGSFVDSISGKTFGTRDPRTGDVITEVAEGDKEDVDIAVKAAREAFDHGKWPRMSGFDRGRIMLKLADLIDQHGEELAMLDSIDSGKLVLTTRDFDIQFATNTLRYYASAADKIHGETLKCSGEFHAYTLKEPIGVVGHIIPWNFPTVLFTAKVAPALAAGCTMIVKPAEQSPLSALYLAHLAKEAGIPDGVINVITGYGPTAGAAIASHMDVDAVSFTGSTEVGKLIMGAAAASNLKTVSLELGGKSPLIIFSDADINKAVQIAWQAVFFNKGEMCLAGSRIYVQEEIYDEFIKKAIENVKNWVVGDPFDPQVHQGPQVDKEQFEKVLRYIELGKREGATLLTGGKAIGEKGYYIEPTIFVDVKEDMLIAKDEIFGPVMSIMKFKTIEEAIEKANNTRYGLAAGVMTNNLNIANRVTRSVRAGLIWINCYLNIDINVPAGGHKMSGFGKDSGLQALEKYLNVKSVITPIYDSPWM